MRYADYVHPLGVGVEGEWDTALTIRVHGTPAPQGSKRHVGNGVMVESSKKVKPWREAVKHAALDALADHCPDCRTQPGGHHLRPEPVNLAVTFYLARPKGHYRTGANAHLLRDTAPTWPAVKPDIDKLIRSTLDALGDAGIWTDDSQVVHISANKRYADHGTPGARIHIRPMGDRMTITEAQVCDGCLEGVYAELETCWHGETRCSECGLCRDCSIETRRP